MKYLYESYVDRKMAQMEFLATIHGYKMKGSRKLDSGSQGNENFLFRDPAEYAEMSDVEKEDLTAKMKKHHSFLASKLGGGR